MKSKTWFFVMFVVFALLGLLGGTFLLAQNGPMVLMPGMQFESTSPMSAWAFTLMQILMVVVFGVTVAGFVLFVTWLGRNTFGAIEPVHPSQSPEDALMTRFQSGEITRGQFEERQHALHSS